MLPENPTFFVRGDDGLEYGPVDLAELREWVQENRAGIGTDVKRDEPNAPWQPWQSHPELVALLAEVTGTTPPVGPVADVIAPMGRRTLAFVLDFLLISILATPILAVCAFLFLPDWVSQYQVAVTTPPFIPPELPSAAEGVADVVADAVFVLYFTLFQAIHAMTPAKQLFRLRVVDAEGHAPNFVQAFWRSVVLIFSMNLLFLPMLYAFLNPQRRALHDIIAGTYVVEV
jgi:uncharacterized RDD family membrane protein YckC